MEFNSVDHSNIPSIIYLYHPHGHVTASERDKGDKPLVLSYYLLSIIALSFLQPRSVISGSWELIDGSLTLCGGFEVLPCRRR